MKYKTTTKWTCDWCGAESETEGAYSVLPSGEARGLLPNGWLTISGYFVCGDCTTAFIEFKNARAAEPEIMPND